MQFEFNKEIQLSDATGFNAVGGGGFLERQHVRVQSLVISTL